MTIDAIFVRSAAGAGDLPRDGLAEVALVGRSNVGKSSLINALVRRRVARTSAAPGKTRLANIYRVTRGGNAPFYLVDLPGYGYARGGRGAAAEFAALTATYFRMERQDGAARADQEQGSRPALPAAISAILLVDARHPGLDSDRAAWQWLTASVGHCAVVGTKIDKLAHGQRIRALRELESVFEDAVLPVSAVTGEGLDQLWTLIDRLPNNKLPPPDSRRPPRQMPRPPQRPRRKNSSSRR